MFFLLPISYTKTKFLVIFHVDIRECTFLSSLGLIKRVYLKKESEKKQNAITSKNPIKDKKTIS